MTNVLVSTRTQTPAVQAAPVQTPALSDDIAALEIDMRIAQELARSEIVPSTYRGKPANILVAAQLGRALGLNPATALQSMHVIEGTPSPSAKLQAALVRRAGHKLRILEHSDEKAVIQIVRADDPNFPITAEFTIEDARNAGYLSVVVERWVPGDNGKKRPERYPLPEGMPVPPSLEDLKRAGAPEWARPFQVKRRDNWHTNRKTMLHHRAVTTCVGMACPEVLSGLDFEVEPSNEYLPTEAPVVTSPVETSAVEADTDVVDAEVVEEPAADAAPEQSDTGSATENEATAEAAPEQETEPAPEQTSGPTIDDLKAAIRASGQRQAAVIRIAAELAAELGLDAPPNATAIADDPDLCTAVLQHLSNLSD